MAWTKPKHSRTQVDWAGVVARVRAHDYEVSEAEIGYLDVIANWRASHGYPLHVFQDRVRRHAEKCDAAPVVVHRLKRLGTMLDKLVRLNTLKLSRMQDIAGCRAILSTTDSVRDFTARLANAGYKLATTKDYIAEPKPDGYRSVHLVYQYEGRGRAADYNGMRIEVQARTTLQHAWATALESVDAFTAQALKANRGTPDWHRFFSLMGSEIALREGCALVPGTPTRRSLLASEIRSLADQLDVERILAAYGATVDYSGRADGDYYLMRLHPTDRQLAVKQYRRNELSLATEEYLITERDADDTGELVVLVSAGSLADLRRAYPNYFLDVGTFLTHLASV